MKKKVKELLEKLPMCYGTYKDYCVNNNIGYKDQLYIIERELVISSHGYYYITPKGREAIK